MPTATRNLLEALTCPEEESRYQAVLDASALDDEDLVVVLREALGDPTWRVRKAAVNQLETRLDPERAWQLIYECLLDTDNAGRRIAAQELLERFRDALDHEIVALSQHADPALRKYALDVFVAQPREQNIPQLLERLQDTDANVRGVAVEALARVATPESIAALQSIVTHYDAHDSLEVVAALNGLVTTGAVVAHEVLKPLLGKAFFHSLAMRLLARSDDVSVVEVLLNEMHKSSLSSARAAALGLVEWAITPEREARVGELLRAQQVKSCASLLELYDVGDDGQLCDTALALARMLGDPDLCATLYAHRRGRWIEQALETVLLACGPQAPTAIAMALGSMEPDDQMAAIEAISFYGDENCIAPVSEALLQSRGRVAVAAANCLQRLAHPSACSALVEAMTSAESDVADACNQALHVLAQENSPQVRRALLEHCGAISSNVPRRELELLCLVAEREDLEALNLLLAHADGEVRALAMDGVGRSIDGDDERIRLLRIGLTDEHAPVRQAAVSAFAVSLRPQVHELLERAVVDEDDGVRALALQRLIGFLGENAEPIITAALQGNSSDLSALIRISHAVPKAQRARILAAAKATNDPSVACIYVEVLSLYPIDEALAGLRWTFQHAHAEVRVLGVDAAEHLARLHPEQKAELVAALSQLINQEADAFVRESALRVYQVLGEAVDGA